MLDIKIQNEFDNLKAVIVGIADNFGGIPKINDCYDPKSKQHVQQGNYPTNIACVKEINNLIDIFKKYNVNVYQPKNINGVNQIFTRDIVFVIDEKLIIPNIIDDRKHEITAIDNILKLIDNSNKIIMPKDARVEGGDVILSNKYIFVGFSESEDFNKYKVARTNRQGLNFIKKTFPDKEVLGFELVKSDENPRINALHLDCCFQPIGNNMAILCKEGFKNEEDVSFLINYFGEKNIIFINSEEMYNMNSNVFSISNNIIVSEKKFSRLNVLLKKYGFIVEEISFSEIGKMSGLLRCSTMPLLRHL
tara:strand:- start:368 stop:1285 length:918 start_codon:yes stop_codon:yes gene_type:complete